MVEITDYPLVACGYVVSNEHMRDICWDPARPYNPQILAYTLANWDCELPEEVRRVTPKIYMRLYKVKNGDWSEVDFFIMTRLVRITNLETADEVLNESELDQKRKKKFIEVFGKNIDEQQMEYTFQLAYQCSTTPLSFNTSNPPLGQGAAMPRIRSMPTPPVNGITSRRQTINPRRHPQHLLAEGTAPSSEGITPMAPPLATASQGRASLATIMTKLEEYPLVGCGYHIPLEHMRDIYWDPAEPFDAGVMAFDLASWDCALSEEQQEGTPRIYMCFRDPRDKELRNYDKVHFFILTRLVRVFTVQMAKDIKVESEVDRKGKDRFIEVFGRGIDERRLVYGIVEWREV
ncbi:hypothetical protein CVT26_007468 [Gymnopilus dilepis]|uniref:Uncharacterized protein n=1 Tax=Gymnopilus dilepis TaxID=231916 RepID=A0A409W7Z0_9AGAR|nr:hypothetical protein CVT26_007468 [Gymnopilus dilepis]